MNVPAEASECSSLQAFSDLMLRAPALARGPDAMPALGSQPVFSRQQESIESCHEVHRVTVIVTDLVEFTSVIRRLGDRSAQQLLRAHDRVLLDCLGRYRGFCVNHTGDGFVAGFESSQNGLACAREIQCGVQRADARLRLRIALHVGEPLLEHGRLFGLCVNTTFRVCARARPGQILLTECFRESCRCSICDLSHTRTMKLKGIPEPLVVHALRHSLAVAV